MTRIFLSGGSGFVGTNIREQLGGVYDIDAPSHSDLPLEDAALVDEYFKDKAYDVIIHTAVKPYHRMAGAPENLLGTNMAMYKNLKKQVASGWAAKMLVTGTGSEYSMDAYRPNMPESYFGQHVPKDEGTLSRYKMAVDIEKNTLPVYNLRLFGLFGRYEKHDMRFISSNILRLLFDQPMMCFQDKRFSYLYIDDLMPVMQWFFENSPKHKTYNVVPDETVTLVEILQMIRQCAGQPDYPAEVQKSGMGQAYTGDNTRLKSEFKRVKFTPIKTAVGKLFDYYKINLEQFDPADLIKDRDK